VTDKIHGRVFIRDIGAVWAVLSATAERIAKPERADCRLYGAVGGKPRVVSAAVHTSQLRGPRCHRGPKFSPVTT